MTAPNDKMINRLIRLAQLDMDAVLAYDQAIAGIDEGDVEIIEALEDFQDDHLRHIDELSAVVIQLGGDVPEFKRDFKGFFIEGMTAVMSRVGTRSALLAMTQNEMLTNATYKMALEGDFSAEVRALIRRNYDDEKRHIAFITQALKEKFGIGEKDVTRPSADSMDEATQL